MAEQQTSNGSVFISYSRKDKEFVHKLYDGLVANKVEAWVDWEGIPLSADWMEEITRAVNGADAFLVIITPDWLASKVCADELELGLKSNKKLIPILYREAKKGTAMPEKLAATNWVYMRDQDDFDSTLPKLIDAINTDLDWVHQHTRILERATEWENKKRNSSFLLQGTDLEDGEKWMGEAAQNAKREVLPLQAEFIAASRKDAVRRQRRLLVGVSLALVVSIFLGIFALFQWNSSDKNEKLARANAATAVANEYARATQQAIAQQNEQLAVKNEELAKKNEIIAKAQRNAAEAQAFQNKAAGLNISTLLAIDSWLTSKAFLAEDIIRQNVSQLPLPVAHMTQGDRINYIHLSPEGLHFVTPSSDGTACVWNIKDGQKQFCVVHDGKVVGIEDAAFTPDGKELITGGDDGTVRFWNTKDGSFEKKLDFGATVWVVNISPDGRWLAIGRDDGFVTSINLVDPKKSPINIKVHGSVTAMAFSPDNHWLAIGTDTGQVEILFIGSKFTILGPKHEAGVLAVSYSPDGKYLLSGGEDSRARLANAKSGKELYVFKQGDWVEDLAFSPDGSWFAAASDDNRVWVWQTQTHEILQRPRHTNYVQAVKISPDGQWIASTGFDKTLRIWDSNSGSQMLEVALDGIGSALAFSPDGKSVIVGDRSGHVSIWDISSLSARAWYIQFPELVHEVRLTTSGDLLANSDDRRIWLLKSDQLLTSRSGTSGKSIYQAEDLTYSMHVSPDSNWMAVAEQDKNRTILTNLTNQTSTLLDHAAAVFAVGFSQDSQLVASAGENGIVALWDVRTGTRKQDFKNPFPINSTAFSKDDTKLAVGLSNTIAIWDIDKHTQVAQLVQAGNIESLEFSDDGNWLASGSSDATTYLWNAKDLISNNQPVHILQQTDAVLSTAFSPDSHWLAVGGADNLVHIWDVNTGFELARIPHTDKVTGITFSKDGKQLITVSRKMIQIWEISLLSQVPEQDLIKIACSRLSENLSRTEWKLLFFEEPYRLICPTLPAGND